MKAGNTFPGDYLAARYALGVASLVEIAEAEARLERDPDFAEYVAQFDALLCALDPGVSPQSPPPSVWERISGALEDEDRAPRTHTIRATDMAWEPFLPGIQRKILFTDKTTLTSGVLYKVAPGAQVGNHTHGVIEECLVIEGEIEVEGIIVRAGDIHIALPGARHGPLLSRHGATVYIRGDMQVHM